jgi:hypothetical protein
MKKIFGEFDLDVSNSPTNVNLPHCKLLQIKSCCCLDAFSMLYSGDVGEGCEWEVNRSGRLQRVGFVIKF